MAKKTQTKNTANKKGSKTNKNGTQKKIDDKNVSAKDKENKKQKNASKKGKHHAETKKEIVLPKKETGKGKRVAEKTKPIQDIQKEEEKAQELQKIEEIKAVVKKDEKMPVEETEKINKTLFYNLIISIGIILYFIFLILGKKNIKQEVYIIDLKVFSMSMLILAIIIIEKAYKKDSGRIAIYGIETIVLALVTFELVYISKTPYTKYPYLLCAISYIFATYYLMKSIITYLKMKRNYFMNHIKEIMDKDE